MRPHIPSHAWAVPVVDTDSGHGLPPSPRPHIEVRCHRRLRGPYTGGGDLVRRVVPEILDREPALVMQRTIAITSVAPDLAPLLAATPQTLTDRVAAAERIRFHPAGRTQRIAHGICELLLDWAHLVGPGGVVVGFRELDDADPTDRELVCTLLRRCDPRVLTVVVEAGDGGGCAGDDALAQALARYAGRVAGDRRPQPAAQPWTDLAQVFIDSDGTSTDPAVLLAYGDLAPNERARRHAARSAALVALDEPAMRLGAIPFHMERGTDPAVSGATAFVDAVTTCFDAGFYAAALDLAVRGRRLLGGGGGGAW
jgi:hypothetical protein